MPKLTLHDTTELERELGLKINHLESLNEDEFKSLTRKSEPNRYNTINSGLIYALPKIFITHKDTSKIEWIIEIAGHGSEELVEEPTSFSVIADFSLQEFKKVIDFFAASLSTRVLLVESCGIGKNIAQQVFTSENLNQMVQHTYPFDIIFFALGEEPSFLYVDLCQKGAFSKFIEKLIAEKGTPDYYSLLLETFLPSTATANPVPQIRYRNTEYFLPALTIRAEKKNTIVISEVMASTRKQPLIIPKRSEIKNIIMYAPAIPFPIDTGFNDIHWYFKFKATQPLLSKPNNDNIIHFASLSINNQSLGTFLRNWPQLKDKKLVVYADKFRFSVAIGIERSSPPLLNNSADLQEILPKKSIITFGNKESDSLLYEMTMTLENAVITPEYTTGIITLSNGHNYILEFKREIQTLNPDGYYFNLSPITPEDPTKIKQNYVIEFEKTYGEIPKFPQQIR